MMKKGVTLYKFQMKGLRWLQIRTHTNEWEKLRSETLVEMRMLNKAELAATTESKHSAHNLCYVRNQVAGPRVFFPPLRRRHFS